MASSGGRDPLNQGRCMKPQDPRPMVATSFCVYINGHEGNCSWADVADIRREKLLVQRDRHGL